MFLPTCFATASEQHRSLAVDAIVPNSIFTSTHAITIDAPTEQVWPWIAQMGAGRAGWYSWDAIDNGGTPSAMRVIPEFQTVVPGDIMPATPGATDAFVVAAVEPPRDLVLIAPDGRGGSAAAWEHVLEPLDEGRTRVIVRARASSQWIDLARAEPPVGHRRIFIERVYAALARLPRPLLIAFASFGHRTMEARHLRGIRRRAASRSHAATGGPWRSGLLVCGILAAALYTSMTVLVGRLWNDYSASSQTISELSAIGAPTRTLWMLLGTLYSALMIGFGWVVWRSQPANRALRVVGMLLMIHGVFGAFWPPMHQRAVLVAGGGTITDTLHIVWAIVTGLLFTLETGFGAAALGRRFLSYSISTMAIVLACGAITGTYSAGIQANLPTPWVGIWERLSSGLYMLWIAVLAIALLRIRRQGADRARAGAAG